MKKAASSGQALLVILLVMSVILTVVFSVLSRSVTEISITKLDEESLRAFGAAEAGIEQALLIIGSTSGTLPNEASFDAEVSDFGVGVEKFVHPSQLFSGQSNTIWFVGHGEDTKLSCADGENCFTGNKMQICWGDSGMASNQSTTPAIEVAVFYDTTQAGVSSGDFSGVRVARAAYDPNSDRRASNNFSAAQTGCSIEGKNMAFSTGDMSFTPALFDIPCWNREGCLLMAKVKVLYNTTKAHPIGMIAPPGFILPSQGQQLISTGTAGEATRKIRVFQTHPEPAFIFDTAVFSPSELTHE